jgi:hypothetical protein
MPATSAAERQKLLLQQEIAKLSGTPDHLFYILFGGRQLTESGAISSRSAHPSSTSSTRHSSNYHPYRGSSRGRGGYNGFTPAARGYGSRGGYSSGAYGRGAHAARGGRSSNSLDLRAANSLNKSATPAQSASTVVAGSSNAREEGEMSPSPPPAGPSSNLGANAEAGPSSSNRTRANEAQSWVKTSSTGNMSLMTAEKR